MLVNMIDILRDAKDKKYAVAQFNINNLEWTRFILEEVNKLGVPAILGVSEGAIKYMGGYKTVANLVKNLIEYLSVSVPISIHLDHGSSFDSCKNAIDAGFTSVMIDYSRYDLDTNIQVTKEVVEYAKERGVSVEAELGPINTNKTTDINYVNLEDSIRFCKETNIDFFAPALGSVHGPYIGEPKLNFDLMKDISVNCNIPLVLHGGSGIPDEQISKSIECGISKININTELQQVWAQSVKDNINNDIYDPRIIIKYGEQSIKDIIDKKIELFNKNGV